MSKVARECRSTSTMFEIHDHTEDCIMFYCCPGCRGHNVRDIACDEEEKAAAYRREYPDNDLPLGAEIRAEADAELDAFEAASAADDKWRDEQDTMGGVPPGRQDVMPEREDDQ